MAGGATEEAFAELAEAYSEDSGGDGGLYRDIYPGQMIAEFDEWCFADGRKPGDHGIVRTAYGWHIMYFSSVGDKAYWQIKAEELLLGQWYEDMISEIQNTYPLTAKPEQFVLLDPAAPTVP